MSERVINFNYDNDYYTPKRLVDYFSSLNAPIEYDPATTATRAAYHHIPSYTALPADGLEADWAPYHTIWVNPPFTKKREFWHKAVEVYHATRATIYFLCPISFLTTKGFTGGGQPVVLYLPPGRIKFERAAQGGQVAKAPAFGSVIISPSLDSQIVYLPKEVLDE